MWQVSWWYIIVIIVFRRKMVKRIITNILTEIFSPTMRMILPGLPVHCGLWEQSLQDNPLLSGPYLQIKHELTSVEILIIESDNAIYCKCNWGTEQHSITKLQYLIDPLVLCASWKKSRRYCSLIWQIWCRSCDHDSTRIFFIPYTSFVASTYPGQVSWKNV